MRTAFFGLTPLQGVRPILFSGRLCGRGEGGGGGEQQRLFAYKMIASLWRADDRTMSLHAVRGIPLANGTESVHFAMLRDSCAILARYSRGHRNVRSQCGHCTGTHSGISEAPSRRVTYAKPSPSSTDRPTDRPRSSCVRSPPSVRNNLLLVAKMQIEVGQKVRISIYEPITVAAAAGECRVRPF